MKQMLKRLLVAMLALVLLGSVALPAAMAAEETLGKPVSNAVSIKLYSGMKETLQVVDSYGDKVSNTRLTWKSSNTAVASVSSKGVVSAKKAGTVTITGTNKKNKSNKVYWKITVKKNKVDYINSKPSASAATYKSWGIALKSVEIVSPTKVVVEYYVVVNYPSSWKASKILYIEDAINLHDKSTGNLVKTIVGDTYQVKSTTISGFKARKGKSVQTIKVTYSGSQVHCANIRLSDYIVSSSTNRTGQLRYYR